MAGDFLFDSPEAHAYYNQMRAISSANNAWNEQQANRQMEFQDYANAKAMDFNAKQAEINRNWQEMMSNTAYQRQVKDMLAAGLNPVLGVSNSGAAVGSGSSASGVTGSGAKAEADTTMAAAFAQMVNTLVQGQTSRDVAQISADAAMHNAETNAEAIKFSALYGSEATKYASRLSSSAMEYSAGLSAAASRYAASLANAAQLQGYAHDTFIHENYPSTMWQSIAAALNVLFGDEDHSGAGAIVNAPKVTADILKNGYNYIQDNLENSPTKKFHKYTNRNSNKKIVKYE